MGIKAEIAIEIDKALEALGAAPAGHAGLGAIYETLREQGAKSDLLGIIGSYRDDTMDDQRALNELRRWNTRPH